MTVDGPSEFSGALPLPAKITQYSEDVAVLAVPDDSGKSAASTETSVRLDANRNPGGILT